MWEKLVAFMFAGILVTMFYHLVTAGLLHAMFRSGNAFDWWFVPLIIIPASILALLALALGFCRRGSTLWGNIGAGATIVIIIFCTVGAPYNCWNQFCF